MKLLIASAALLIPCLALADEKASVMLDASGSSSSGGSGREVALKVDISKGFGSKKHDIPVPEQIAALRQHIAYLTLMEKHKVDLRKEITGVYVDAPLADVLKEVLPDVSVKFDGVDEKETVKSLTCAKASLASVISWLDDAAGVYFVFSETGILVTAKPPVAP